MRLTSHTVWTWFSCWWIDIRMILLWLGWNQVGDVWYFVFGFFLLFYFIFMFFYYFLVVCLFCLIFYLAFILLSQIQFVFDGICFFFVFMFSLFSFEILCDGVEFMFISSHACIYTHSQSRIWTHSLIHTHTQIYKTMTPTSLPTPFTQSTSHGNTPP